MSNQKLNNLFSDGANWIKADFHLHSPLIHSFTLPSGINLTSKSDLERLVKDYIVQLKKAQIQIGAVTDYQQIRKDWFKLLQNEAVKENIFIFSGIELSITSGRGLHVLLIFDYNQDIDGINDYIKSLDTNPHQQLINDDRSHRDITLQKNLPEVLNDIKSKFQSLIIFPHPEDKDGIIASFQPKEAAELIKLADAIEYINDANKNKLISTGILDKSWWENFSIVENTDPKSINEIGCKKRDDKIRCTFLKLSSISVNAFKIALHDPTLRVSIYEKPEPKKDRIVSLKVEGSGFLKNLHIDFNRDLNVLIGGRGVGKSAIVETIRYCLDLPVYSEKSFREDFVKSVVGSGGKIELIIERVFGDTQQCYKIKRIIGQLPEVEGKDIPPTELFEEKTPLLIGQKELYALSSDDKFQLSLIDELIGDEIKKESNEFKKLLLKLEENATQLLQLQKKINQKEDTEQRIKTINELIKTFQELGVVEKMAKHTALIEDDKNINRSYEEFKKQIEELKEKFEESVSVLKSEANLLSNGKSIEKSILAEASGLLSEFNSYLENLKNDLTQKTKKYLDEFNLVINKWQERKKTYETEINEIKKELSSKGLAPDRYEALVKEKTSLEPLLKEYEKINEQIKNLQKDRGKIKSAIKEKRHQLFTVRKNKIEKLNKKLVGRIQMEVLYLANRSEFKEHFKNLLSGSGVFPAAIDNIIEGEKVNIDGIELSQAIAEGIEKIKELFGLTDAMASRIINWFSEKEKLYELETIFPDDKIIIKLKVGDGYSELSKLSAGQKATALLILLFAQDDRILIIDQPEEDLDNRFIYEDVVKILREIKNKRQIILVTHNANIPVLGDADQTIVLDASSETCRMANYGSIDKKTITDDIKSIMEGGDEAFRRRIEKYGV
ncbi:MAG: TrlF family AAA-like ATPase [Candidatus Humimicrobiaceae bacterium]